MEEQLLGAVAPIYINGKTQVAKKINIETTVPVSDSSFLLLFSTPAWSQVYMWQTKWDFEDWSFATKNPDHKISVVFCVSLSDNAAEVADLLWSSAKWARDSMWNLLCGKKTKHNCVVL